MGERVKAGLACVSCEVRTYTFTKRKKKTERMELTKYCPRCKKRTVHREKK